MKKILIAFDGNHFSNGAFDFARKISKIEPILLTGLFLPEVDYASLWSYSSAMNGPALVPVASSENDTVQETAISKFRQACESASIEYRVHKRLFDFTLPELKKESSFSDLLIVGSQKFYENLGTDQLNDFLRDTLHEMLCPIVVVPENYQFPYTNILTYDGSPSSVFAIKQFAYLFPDMAKNDSVLLHVTHGLKSEIPEKLNITELTACHYPELNMLNLEIESTQEITNWLKRNPGSIVISGAFGRSELSRLFKKSFVQEIIKEHCLPVFVAHR